MQRDDLRAIWRSVEALPVSSGFGSACDLGATLVRRITSIISQRELIACTRKIRWSLANGVGASLLVGQRNEPIVA